MIRSALALDFRGRPADNSIEFIGGPWDGERRPVRGIRTEVLGIDTNAPAIAVTSVDVEFDSQATYSFADALAWSYVRHGGTYKFADTLEWAYVWVPREEP